MITTCRLGRTDIEVSPVGLGCWQFSQSRGLAGGYWPALPLETAREIVRASLDRGVTWFDTAEVYGNGASEETLAAVLREIGTPRDRYVIADKWMPAFRFAGSVERTFPERERALGRLGVDLHQIHQPFSFSGVEKQVAAMGRLVRDGKVRAVGVSNFNERLMRRAHARLAVDGVPLATNQVRYSLLDREIERNGVLDAALELGVSIIAYSPLAQGVLTGRFHGDEDIRRAHGPRKFLRRFRAEGLDATRPLVGELRRVAKAHGASPAQVALAWVVRRHGTAVVAIPGATSVAQAEANAAAQRIELSSEELERLGEAGLDAERRLKRLR